MNVLSRAKYEVLPQDEYSKTGSDSAIRSNRLSQLTWRLLTVSLIVTVSFVAGTQYNKWLSTDSFGIELAWCTIYNYI